MAKIIVSIFLLLYGFVHLLYLGHSQQIFELQPGLIWPEGSWFSTDLLGDKKTRLLANALLILIAIAFILAGCSVSLRGDSINPFVPAEQMAQEVLIDFFRLLHSQKYQQASELYGGSYDTMIEHNPTIDPSNHKLLFQHACEINGAQCLEISGIPVLDQASDNDYTFHVKFVREDGSIFSREQCCGEPQSPQRIFSFTVKQVSEGEFKVIDAPIYVP